MIPLYIQIQGSYTLLHWTFDDGNGNSVDAVQAVLIADITAPTASCPDDVLTCDGTVSAIGLTELTDNCSTPDITYELSGASTGSGSGDASSEIFAPGETTVTYTMEDGNGNSSQCSFTVTNQLVEDVVVGVADGRLTVETEGSYQWINCEDNSEIAGETGSTFNPGVSGEYAVIVTRGICSATSLCYSLDYTGLGRNNHRDGIEVYPNPADEYLTIQLDREHTNVSIKVVNSSGQAVMVEEMDRVSKTRLDVSRLKAGFYLIQVHSDQADRVVRFMKE